MRKQRNQWSAEFTGKLAGRLMDSAIAARDNGLALIDEARCLHSNGRLARATALTILAEEELIKAFVLRVVIRERRWDGPLYEGLRYHGPKQALAHGMRELLGKMEDRAHGVSNARRNWLIPPPLTVQDVLPPQAELDGVFASMDEMSEKKPLDRLKQSAFYVSVGKDGGPEAGPESITEADYQRCLSQANAIASILAMPGYW